MLDFSSLLYNGRRDNHSLFLALKLFLDSRLKWNKATESKLSVSISFFFFLTHLYSVILSVPQTTSVSTCKSKSSSFIEGNRWLYEIAHA